MKRFKQSKESGAAVVEAAIVIPVLALLVLGMADLGIALHFNSQLQHVGHEVAMSASLPVWQYSEVVPSTTDNQEVLNCLTDLTTDSCVMTILNWRLERLKTTHQLLCAGDQRGCVDKLVPEIQISAPDPISKRRTLNLRLRTTYRPITPAFVSSIPLTSENRGAI